MAIAVFLLKLYSTKILLITRIARPQSRDVPTTSRVPSKELILGLLSSLPLIVVRVSLWEQLAT
jgi:hypothetical protein